MSTELNELRDSARQVLSGQGLAASAEKTWPLVQELGWLLVAVPQEQGGLGQGIAGACAFHAEFGRSLNAAPYLPAMLAIDAVLHAGRADRDAWLERLTAGERVTAPLAASSFSIDARHRLSGTATALASADQAGQVLLCGADRVLLLPLRQAGVECSPRATWDSTRKLFDLRLSDVALDPDCVLATGAAAQALSQRLATHRDFALAADAVGGASALLDMTVEYLQTRRQFGRPLALFQALKHRCADLKTMVCAAEALLDDSLARAADVLDTPQATVLGLGAKAYACTVYARVAEEALQLHGGIGMTAEHGCHLYLKRALLNEHLGRGREHYEAGIAEAFIGGAP